MRKSLTTAVIGAALACLLGVALCLTGCGKEDPAGPGVDQRFGDNDLMPQYGAGTPYLQASDKAPDFTVELVDENGLTGETLSLADLQGKAAALLFWAPW